MHPRLRVRSRVLVVLALLAPLGLAVPGLLRAAARPAPAVATTTPDDDDATAPAPSTRLDESRPLVGFAINAHHISDLPLYLESVDRIAELGANALVVVTPWFQERADSSTMRRVPHKCPTEKQLTAILRRARALGLYTALQPIVLIENPGEKDWRGVIRPKSWDQWWASYDVFIDYHVQVARAADVDQLCIGSELNTTEPQREHWRRIVDRIRLRYDGLLSYSANWDRYDKVDLWPLVDIMSVSSYFELARDKPSAPVADLVAAWSTEREKLLAFARKWERPLVLSEVGYPSLPWAAAHPWNYVAKRGQKADHEAQARCYRAFFEAWTETVTEAGSPVAGFFCYRWDPYHHGQSSDTGYGIDGKPAFEVVREGFRRIRTVADAPAP